MISKDVNLILNKYSECEENKTLLIGVSGGADSIALLHMISNYRDSIVVAYFNHLLRAEADSELKYVQSLADNLACKFVTGEGDVRHYAKGNHLSVEEAARKLRYQFLFSSAQNEGASTVLVAHHVNDQVETIVHNFIRGTGLKGLQGMREYQLLPEFNETIPIIRPLLTIKKTEIIEYCNQNQLVPVEDVTNKQLVYTRNRIRIEVIPQLKEINPNIEQSILNLSNLVVEDENILDEIANEAVKGCLLFSEKDNIAFDAEQFNKFPIGIRKRIVRIFFAQIDKSRNQLDYQAASRAISFVEKNLQTGIEMLIGGYQLIREGHLVWLTRDIDTLPFDFWPQINQSILIEKDSQILLKNGWGIYVSLLQNSDIVFDEIGQNKNDFVAYFNIDHLSFPLSFDIPEFDKNFSPLGMGGKSMSLKDLFINEKIPKRARQSWPILVQNSKILWVPGVKRATHNLVSKIDNGIVKIEVKKS